MGMKMESCAEHKTFPVQTSSESPDNQAHSIKISLHLTPLALSPYFAICHVNPFYGSASYKDLTPEKMFQSYSHMDILFLFPIPVTRTFHDELIK